MRTLQWRHTDWTARKFVFQVGPDTIGQLSFNNYWNLNAIYVDSETSIKFSQKSFFDDAVVVTQNEKVIGTLSCGFMRQSLRLTNGERYDLVSNFLGRDVKWKNQRGEELIKYHQATLSTMGRGTIHTSSTLSRETEILMISGGLFIKQLMLKRMLIVMVAMFPAFIAARG
jgi:hypothetical protein